MNKELEKVKQTGQLNKFKEADKEVQQQIAYIEYDEDESYANIDLEIQKESDIYQKYTMLFRKRISQEIMNYLEEATKYVPLYKPVKINVTLPNQSISEELLKQIELMVERSLARRIIDLNIIIKDIILKSFLMIIFGLISMVVNILLDTYFSIYMLEEVFMIASWVFIWKAVEGLFFDRRKTHISKLKLLQIYSADYESKI